MKTSTALIEDQQLPDLFITVESQSQLQQRQLLHLFKEVPRSLIPTVEKTLTIYGLKAYYSLPPGANTAYEAASFNVYVSRFVNIQALKSHLKAHGVYRTQREICFIDGTYEEEEDCQAGTSWQEALKESKTSEAFHGGEPGKSVDASVNTHEGHYVAFAKGNKTNHGWNETIPSEDEVSAYLRTCGIDPDSGWRSQW